MFLTTAIVGPPARWLGQGVVTASRSPQRSEGFRYRRGRSRLRREALAAWADIGRLDVAFERLRLAESCDVRGHWTARVERRGDVAHVPGKLGLAVIGQS